MCIIGCLTELSIEQYVCHEGFTPQASFYRTARSATVQDCRAVPETAIGRIGHRYPPALKMRRYLNGGRQFH